MTPALCRRLLCNLRALLRCKGSGSSVAAFEATAPPRILSGFFLLVNWLRRRFIRCLLHNGERGLIEVFSRHADRVTLR